VPRPLAVGWGRGGGLRKRPLIDDPIAREPTRHRRVAISGVLRTGIYVRSSICHGRIRWDNVIADTARLSDAWVMPRATTPAVRTVVMLAYPGVQILDVTGPLEVFARAGEVAVERGIASVSPYRVEVLAPRAGPLRSQSGVGLVADRAIDDVTRGIDTLLVAGGRQGTAEVMQSPAVLAWLRRMVPRVRRWGSVCSGTFILAAAGLLDGRRVTTHWAACALFANMFPKVTLDPEPIYVRDGNLYSSAGVTAGMDLALALVEEDLGRAVALETARGLVLFLRRPGGQSQFSAQLAVQAADRQPLRELVAWIVEHPSDDLAVETLAHRVAMSPRHFARVFTREVGMTPARYVETVRVEAARRRLEESTHGVDAIAATCGFGTAETMRRAFLRIVRVPPSAYRGRFRSALGHETSRRSA
jgi:transcriptional regulator GlxA family with amidase domain